MTQEQRGSNSRWLPLVALYFATLSWGAIQCFPQQGGVHYIFALLMASMAALWVVFDARHRGKPLVSIVQFLVLVSWPVAVPIYLISTRGVRGLGWSLLNLVGLAVMCLLGFFATSLAVYGSDAFFRLS